MASKRELIEPHKGDKRYVRRDPKGEFKESDDVGRSLAVDLTWSVARRTSLFIGIGQFHRGDAARGMRARDPTVWTGRALQGSLSSWLSGSLAPGHDGY